MKNVARLFPRAVPVAIAVIFCASSSQGIENEVWISPNGIGAANVAVTNVSATDVVYGNLMRYPSNVVGTPTYPFRCPDAQSLNVVLVSVLTNAHMTIHFMAGTFHVLTNGITPLPGWKLRGEGIDNTTLQLVSGALVKNAQPFIGGFYDHNEGFEVSDMTVDCNMQNAIDTGGNVGPVLAPGSSSRISRVKTINWGAYTNLETFLLVTGPAPGLANVTNIVVEDCIVAQPATNNYSGGITAIGDSISARGSVIRDNFLYNVQAVPGIGPGGFHAITSFNTVRQNYMYDLTGASAGVYADSWDFRDILIDRNVIDNAAHGIFYNIENLVTNILMKDNIIRPSEGGGGIAYGTEGDWAVGVTNLAIAGNIVYPCSLATNAVGMGLNFSAYGYVNIYGTVMNNIFQGSGFNWDVFFPSQETPNWGQPNYPYPLQLNTWSGNVNFLGTELSDMTDARWQPGHEDDIIFTPAANGWYRLIAGSGSAGAGSGGCSGTITVESDIWGATNLTDAQFTFAINGYATSTNNLGRINEIRQGGWTSQVIQARIGSDSPGDGPTYLDINVTNVSSGARFIRVISDGHFRGRLLNPPPFVSKAPALSVARNLYVANLLLPPQNFHLIPGGSASP